MQNIELKIEVDNFKKISEKLKKIHAKKEGLLRQVDTYYHCKNGRLKMREENNKIFELVFYQRPDVKSAKVSDFEVIVFSRVQALAIKESLKKAYGEKVVIKKERQLWMFQNTRIHLDKVEQLGTFLELETLVKKNINEAKKEYFEIVKLLELDKYKKLKKSYSDLLLNKKK